VSKVKGVGNAGNRTPIATKLVPQRNGNLSDDISGAWLEIQVLDHE
jgi:hypothetical protein